MNIKKSKFASSLCAILMAATFFFLPFTEVRAAEPTSASAVNENSATTETTPVSTATEMTAIMTETSTVVEVSPATANPIPPAETLPLTPVPMGANGNGSDSKNPPAPTNGKTYCYNVTITFGYFSFRYDWGVWNSNSFSYQASPSSLYPAADTVQGNPGWYNFDGVNNKISIECQDTLTPLFNVEYPFTLTYQSVMTADNSGPLYPNISMKLYTPVEANEVGTWDMQLSPAAGGSTPSISLKEINPADVKVYSEYHGANVVKRDFYVSFSGVPLDNTDKQFSSTQMQTIGTITLKIGKPLNLQIPINPAT